MEEILHERRRGRKNRERSEVLVKWAGYALPTWEPREALEDVAALNRFEVWPGAKGGRNVTGYAQMVECLRCVPSVMAHIHMTARG